MLHQQVAVNALNATPRNDISLLHGFSSHHVPLDLLLDLPYLLFPADHNLQTQVTDLVLDFYVLYLLDFLFSSLCPDNLAFLDVYLEVVVLLERPKCLNDLPYLHV